MMLGKNAILVSDFQLRSSLASVWQNFKSQLNAFSKGMPNLETILSI